MSTTDIIPDIHGQAEKLRVALRNLGWQRKGTSWSHPEPHRRIVFLGDFIDRGAENGEVIRIVRELMEAGSARAIMGNHELNALHFHTLDPDSGQPLRGHTQKNIDQHKSFLKEFPVGAPETKAVLKWMQTLPLFIEENHLRAVHAAWIQAAVDELRVLTENGVLSDDQLVRSGRKEEPICDLSETLTKGPELTLPDGHWFFDKSGHVRRDIRLQWWNGDARTWRQVAISVPDPEQLPDQLLPPSLQKSFYPPNDRPVFFGHYWLSGQPVLQGANVLCLDYSAGTDGPLATYTLADEALPLALENISIHR